MGKVGGGKPQPRRVGSDWVRIKADRVLIAMSRQIP
jgi:hypothetical protein